MKVLLCTPYEEGKEIVFGGITIWARNIIDYYKTLDKSISVDVQPFDRITFVNNDMTLFKRIYCGIIEYSNIIEQAKETLKKQKYDIVHLNSSANLSLFKDLIMINVAHKLGVKTVLHLHFGRIPQIIEKNNWEWKLLKFVLRASDMVITMDLNSFNKLKELGYKKISYLPNPISKEVVEQIKQDKGSILKIEKTILYVGHVIKSKGIFELAEATKGLDYTSLRIVGRCSDYTKKQLLSINSNMNFVGELSHKQVIKEMLASDIFILPSHTEGFPNVILESMASRCAIISTSVGAISEMLDNDSLKPCGIIVSPKDILQLRSAINDLLNNKKLRDTYRERAEQRVIEMYSVDVIWRQLSEVWEKTVL